MPASPVELWTDTSHTTLEDRVGSVGTQLSFELPFLGRQEKIMPTTRWVLAVLAALVLLAAACGDDDDASGDTEAASATSTPDGDDAAAGEAGDGGDDDTAAGEAADADFPVTIESAGGTWTLETQPQRIVSLSPMATELLFAMGAGDRVAAVDAFSNYPPEAPVTDLSGFDPNLEAITAFEPDLVVIVNDANDLIAGLAAVDIPVFVSEAPADIEAGYAEIAELGVAVGSVDGAAELVATMRSEIDAALAEAPDVPVRIYHELDETFYSASSFGFVGAVYQELGTENIADAGDPDETGFPQLTEEYIVEADPELIIITNQVDYTPEDVAGRPGWEQVSAVAAGSIVVVDADAASRWGPRLPEFINAVATALASVESAVS